MVNFCRRNNLDWAFLEVFNRSITNFNREIMTNNSILKSYSSKSIGACPISFTLIFIGYDGGVYLCCNDINRKEKICEYLKYPFQKIVELKELNFLNEIDLSNNYIIFPI